MSARQEAIEAMRSYAQAASVSDLFCDHEGLLNAIPTDVLARYVVERRLAALTASEATMGEHIFRDPISDRECVLRIGMGVDRLRPGLPGAVVLHGECPQPADVSPDLDAFYCPTCRWNGRVSGQWVMHRLDRFRDAGAVG